MEHEDERTRQRRQANYRAVAAHLSKLPLLPAVIARLMALDRDDENYFETLLPLGEQDPTFAVRLIRLANSSAFRPVAPITDLRSAVARIGSHQIAGFVTSLAVMQVFEPTKREARNLWLHSIQVAVAARVIAARFYAGRVQPDSAYLCGLLHDIGRFIVFDVAPEAFDVTDEEGWGKRETAIDVEQRVLGISHTELGWQICQRWLLPEHIARVVRLHHVHMVVGATGGERLLRDLLGITWVADHLSMMVLYDRNLPTMPEEDAAALLDRRCIASFNDTLPVSGVDLLGLMPDVVAEAEEHCDALGLAVH